MVETVEPVGNEIFVNLRHGNLPLVARLPPERMPETGAPAGFTLRPGQVLFFDRDSGARLVA
ncbi:MAG: sn-glycerol-3-phosphate ABC transporter ATP-binding protein UgpC, partial [Thermomonas sp.]